jgi:hypothetical protein
MFAQNMLTAVDLALRDSVVGRADGEGRPALRPKVFQHQLLIFESKSISARIQPCYGFHGRGSRLKSVPGKGSNPVTLQATTVEWQWLEPATLAGDLSTIGRNISDGLRVLHSAGGCAN